MNKREKKATTRLTLSSLHIIDVIEHFVYYQQWTRWRTARVFESIIHDLDELQRMLRGCDATPSVVVLDGQTLQSTPESGHRASYDGAKKRKGSKSHIAVDTLGQLLNVVITPANEQERVRVGELC